jgi:hypothetical protein
MGHVSPIARDSCEKYRCRQPNIAAAREFGGGHDLAARDSGKIGGDALDFINRVLLYPFGQRFWRGIF